MLKTLGNKEVVNYYKEYHKNKIKDCKNKINKALKNSIQEVHPDYIDNLKIEIQKHTNLYEFYENY